MCGGKGTRLTAGPDAERTRDDEKPLVTIGGEPMIDRVLRALSGSRVERIHAVVSPHTPATREHLATLTNRVEESPTGIEKSELSIVDAPGEGYVADLTHALDRVGKPALTVVADVPLLAPEVVNRVLEEADETAGTSLTVCVPAAVKRALGASVDTTFERDGRELAPTGVNVVTGSDDALYLSYDVRLSVNVNRPADRTLAEGLCN